MDSSSSPLLCPGCQRPLETGRALGLCPRCLLARAALATEADPVGSPSPVPELATVAEAFPQLEILELIGRGGMGVVYRARQKSLNRLVALKLLAPGREREPAFAEHFAREAQALAALNHPNIVTVHDFGFATSASGEGAGGYYFLLMEFVDGVNLRQAMQAGRFTPEQALAIVPPICGALQYAHERGIVHRDIKPENLLLDKAGRIMIADFGIAKMLALDDGAATFPPSDGLKPGKRTDDESATSPESQSPTSAAKEAPPALTARSAVGTPQYMAPEQGDPAGKADHRADIYSLGVVLYELLTGELPGARFEPPSHKVQIDVRLDEIVLRALAVHPELRFATAAEFRTQLDTVVAAPSGARTAPVTPRLLKSSNSTLTTPETLATFEGQFFLWRTRGQLLLDERQLTHARDGLTTVIPLVAIRDLSLGRYPLAMNPAGLDLLSVTYDDGGQTKRVFLSPMDGVFAWPSTWNARVADWQGAIAKAVAQATGKEPALTPREQVSVPPGHGGLKAFLIGACALSILVVFLVLIPSRGIFGGGGSASLFLFLGLMLLGGIIGQWVVRRLFSKEPSYSPAPSPWTRVVGSLLLFGALALGWGLLASRNAQAYAEVARTMANLQRAKAEEAIVRLSLEEFETRTPIPQTEQEKHHVENERRQLQANLEAAISDAQGTERILGQGVLKPNRSEVLLKVLPLLVGGFWLLLRPGLARPSDAEPRRWMRWLGAGLLAAGLPLGGLATWIAFQIARDSSWNPAPAEAFLTFAVWIATAVCLVVGLSLLAVARPGSATSGPRKGGASAVLVVLGTVLLTFFLFKASDGSRSRDRILEPSTGPVVQMRASRGFAPSSRGIALSGLTVIVLMVAGAVVVAVGTTISVVLIRRRRVGLGVLVLLLFLILPGLLGIGALVRYMSWESMTPRVSPPPVELSR